MGISFINPGGVLAGAVNAADGRTALGLGSIATQNANAIAVTGGSLASLAADLAVADGGTGASTALAAALNLGLSRAWRALVYNSTSQQTPASSADTNLQTYTLPGGTVAEADAAILIFAAFTFAANANAKRVRILVADKTVYDSGTQNQNGGSLFVFAFVVRGTVTTAGWNAMPWVSGSSLFSAAHTQSSGSIASPAGGWASNLTIKGYGTGGGTAGDVVQRSMLVTHIPGA